MNSTKVSWAVFDDLENTKTCIMGPVRRKLPQSILDLKLTDEVYFKDSTFVGNSVHTILKILEKVEIPC